MNLNSLSKLLLTGSILLFSAEICADEVFRTNRKTNRLYERGNYEEALRLYEDALLLDPSDPALKMNKGSALYRLQDYDAALEAYSGTLSQEDKNTLADAHYNLGNIFFRQGQKLQETGDPAAQQMYQQALENYIRTLKIRPEDKESKWNLQLAHQKIEEVEMQQERSQSGDQSDDDDDGDSEQDQQKGEGDQQQEQQKPDQQQSDDHSSQPQQQEVSADAGEDKDMEKEEAARLIQMYADDADDLHKPPEQKQTGTKRLEKEW